VLLLPGANADQARTRLNQLLQQFSAMRFENSAGETFSCSFSAGVAVAASSDDLLADLLSQADAALYRAKATGRACVALATAG
jgi:diguanylate cyclase (GGDEF)-like protein